MESLGWWPLIRKCVLEGCSYGHGAFAAVEVFLAVVSVILLGRKKLNFWLGIPRKKWEDLVRIGAFICAVTMFCGTFFVAAFNQFKQLQEQRNSLFKQNQELISGIQLERAPKTDPLESLETKGLEEMRSELERTKAQLASAQKKLQRFDPKHQPLSSASATVELDLMKVLDVDAKRKMVMSVAYVGMGTGTNALMLCRSQNYTLTAIGTNEARCNAVAELDSGQLLARPVLELTNAEYLLIHLEGIYEPGVAVNRGSVAITINKNIRLKFDVPKQKLPETGYIFINNVGAKIQAELMPP